jgi:protein-L-isoaspartate O-methyltransferase
VSQLEHWPAFWDRLEEHVLFRVEAEDYVARLTAALGRDFGRRVLDFGCGFGFVAALLAPRVPELFVFDASEGMRRRAQRRLASYRSVRVLGAPAVAAWPAGLRFDLILVNSVVQYMPPPQFQQWLGRWARMLAPSGRLVLSDLVTVEPRPLRELVELFRLSARGGCLLATVRKGLGEVRQYSRARHVQPLARVALDDLRRRAGELGLSLEVLPSNLTYRRGRASVLLGLASPTARITPPTGGTGPPVSGPKIPQRAGRRWSPPAV